MKKVSETTSIKRSRKRHKNQKKSQLKKLNRIDLYRVRSDKYKLTKEFDPGSGRTLAARLTHASRTSRESLLSKRVADG